LLLLLLPACNRHGWVLCFQACADIVGVCMETDLVWLGYWSAASSVLVLAAFICRTACVAQSHRTTAAQQLQPIHVCPQLLQRRPATHSMLARYRAC
jgi:hypothetical protein